MDQQSYMHCNLDMAAKWRQDVQYDRQLDPKGEADRDQRLQIDTAGRVKLLEGQWECQGTHKGVPVWRHREGHLYMLSSTSGRWVVGREVGSS